MKALGAFLLGGWLLWASPTPIPAAPEEGKSDLELREVEASGVHGNVMLVDLPAGGTLAVVNLTGLTPDSRYLVVRAANGTCDIESYEEDDAVVDLTANASGRATATLELEEEIGEIGTISVWTFEDALVACAMMGT